MITNVAFLIELLKTVRAMKSSIHSLSFGVVPFWF